jgi:hypothetical protein
MATYYRQIITCHQLQVPMPIAFERWSCWAQRVLPKDAMVAQEFAVINEHLAAVRAEIKRNGINDFLIVSSRLLAVDAMVEAWRQRLPHSWAFKSYRRLGSTSMAMYDAQCEIYPNLWLAVMWNNYRCVRLLIHESIASAATLQTASIAAKKIMQTSTKTLMAMADGVCYSVPYHLGFRYANELKEAAIEGNNERGTPGGYLLLWPLFLSGMLRTTPPRQRYWIASTLRQIGSQMGLKLAIYMAASLEEKILSFSDEATWLIGEFYPR